MHWPNVRPLHRPRSIWPGSRWHHGHRFPRSHGPAEQRMQEIGYALVTAATRVMNGDTPDPAAPLELPDEPVCHKKPGETGSRLSGCINAGEVSSGPATLRRPAEPRPVLRPASCEPSAHAPPGPNLPITRALAWVAMPIEPANRTRMPQESSRAPSREQPIEPECRGNPREIRVSTQRTDRCRRGLVRPRERFADRLGRAHVPPLRWQCANQPLMLRRGGIIARGTPWPESRSNPKAAGILAYPGHDPAQRSHGRRGSGPPKTLRSSRAHTPCRVRPVRTDGPCSVDRPRPPTRINQRMPIEPKSRGDPHNSDCRRSRARAAAGTHQPADPRPPTLRKTSERCPMRR